LSGGLIRYNQIKISRGKHFSKLIIERKALHCGNNNLGLAPIIAVFFVDNARVIILQCPYEILPCLVFQLDSVDQEKDTAGIACS